MNIILFVLKVNENNHVPSPHFLQKNSSGNHCGQTAPSFPPKQTPGIITAVKLSPEIAG